MSHKLACGGRVADLLLLRWSHVFRSRMQAVQGSPAPVDNRMGVRAPNRSANSRRIFERIWRKFSHVKTIMKSREKNNPQDTMLLLLASMSPFLFETGSVRCRHIEPMNMAWTVWKRSVMDQTHDWVNFCHHVQPWCVNFKKLSAFRNSLVRDSEPEWNYDCRSVRSFLTCWITEPRNPQWRLTALTDVESRSELVTLQKAASRQVLIRHTRFIQVQSIVRLFR